MLYYCGLVIIVMLLLNVDAQKALQLLEDSDGRIAQTLQKNRGN